MCLHATKETNGSASINIANQLVRSTCAIKAGKLRICCSPGRVVVCVNQRSPPTWCVRAGVRVQCGEVGTVGKEGGTKRLGFFRSPSFPTLQSPSPTYPTLQVYCHGVSFGLHIHFPSTFC